MYGIRCSALVSTLPQIMIGAAPATSLTDKPKNDPNGKLLMDKIEPARRSTGTVSEIQKMEDTVETLYVAKKYPEAIKLCREVIRRAPDRPFNHFRLGIACYRQAILVSELSPSSAEINQLLLASEAAYAKELTLAQHDRITLNNIGVTRHTLGERTKNTVYLVKAEQDYKSAISKDNTYNAAPHNLALLFRLEKRHTEADAMFQKALALNLEKGYQAVQYYYLGVSACELGKYSVAIKHFTKALALGLLRKNKNVDFYLNYARGAEAFDLNKFNDTIRYLEQAKKSRGFNAQDIYFYLMLGVSYQFVGFTTKKNDRGYFSRSSESFTTAIRFGHRSKMVYKLRGVNELMLGNHIKAREDFQKAKKDVDTLTKIGMTYYCEKNYPEALGQFSKALELKSNGVIKYKTYFWRGRTYIELSNTAAANADFKAADGLLKKARRSDDHVKAWLMITDQLLIQEQLRKEMAQQTIMQRIKKIFSPSKK